MMLPTEVDVTVQIDEVQSVPDGFGFHLKASEYTWITLVFDTKAEAEAAHSHAEKAVAKAKALEVDSIELFTRFVRRHECPGYAQGNGLAGPGKMDPSRP